MKVLYIFIYIVLIGCDITGNKKVEIEKDTDRDVLYLAALNGDYDRDYNVTRNIENHRRRFLGSVFLNNTLVGRVSVTLNEISNQYEKTKNQYKREFREVLILRFTVKTKKEASAIVRFLASNNKKELDKERFYKKHKPKRELIQEQKINPEIKNRIFDGDVFLINKNEKLKNYNVLNVLKIFGKGSVRELIYVQDEIHRKLVAIKTKNETNKILDSLRVEYSIGDFYEN